MFLLWGSANAGKCLGTTEIFFDSGSAVASAEEEGEIGTLIEHMRQSEISFVAAVGYADEFEHPQSGANTLAMARAAKVIISILQRRPELKNVIYFEGRSAEQSNSNAPSRNRRVDLELSCQNKDDGDYIYTP